jgi:hypothetical protein
VREEARRDEFAVEVRDAEPLRECALAEGNLPLAQVTDGHASVEIRPRDVDPDALDDPEGHLGHLACARLRKPRGELRERETGVLADRARRDARGGGERGVLGRGRRGGEAAEAARGRAKARGRRARRAARRVLRRERRDGRVLLVEELAELEALLLEEEGAFVLEVCVLEGLEVFDARLDRGAEGTEAVHVARGEAALLRGDDRFRLWRERGEWVDGWVGDWGR